MSQIAFNAQEIITRILKYMLEGIVVAVASFFIPGKKLEPQEIIVIGIVAAATFSLLDLFAPAIGSQVRNGAAFGVGANLVGFPNGGPTVKGVFY